jgi:hypothetical protein
MANAATAGPPSPSAGASDNSNPYAVITDRNVFHLNPPPVPAAVVEKPVDVPKVYLDGIMKVGNEVRVFFSIPPKDKKPQASYFDLAANEKATGGDDEVLELVRIHPDQQGVDVIINGTAETLSLEKNSLASADSKTNPFAGARPAPPAPAPAAASSQSSAIIVGGDDRESSSRGGVAVGGGGGEVTTIGGGGNSLSGGSGVSVAGGGGPGSGGGASPSSYGGNSSGGVSVSGGGASTGSTGSQLANTLFSGSGNQNLASAENVPPTTLVPPDQQALILAAQKQVSESSGIPMPPLLPNIQDQVNGGGSSDSGPPPLPGLGQK